MRRSRKSFAKQPKLEEELCQVEEEKSMKLKNGFNLLNNLKDLSAINLPNICDIFTWRTPAVS